MATLKDQIHRSMEKTMHGPQPLTDAQADDVAAFLRALRPPPPVAAARGLALDDEARERGKTLFNQSDCIDCHRSPKYTSEKVYEIGLSDEMGNRKFNPPSLRGVSQRARWFHDGRAKKLEEVFTLHGHQAEGLSTGEIRDLLAFLEGL